MARIKKAIIFERKLFIKTDVRREEHVSHSQHCWGLAAVGKTDERQSRGLFGFVKLKSKDDEHQRIQNYQCPKDLGEKRRHAQENRKPHAVGRFPPRPSLRIIC
jgi:hypothetical protein